MLFGKRLPERIRATSFAGLGLFTIVIGIQMALKTQQSLVVLGSLLLGGVLGEWLHIEEKLRDLGRWLEERFATQEQAPITFGMDPTFMKSDGAALAGSNASSPGAGSRFVRGFLTASLIYAIGPMAILGAIQDGISGDVHLLVIKAIMDGFASLAFASTLGIGVLFSSLVVLVYQGGISLAASQVQAWMTPTMMVEMTATGGVLLVGIALSSLLEIKPIRVGNFLPALLAAPLIVMILTALGVGV